MKIEISTQTAKLAVECLEDCLAGLKEGQQYLVVEELKRERRERMMAIRRAVSEIYGAGVKP